MTGPAIRYPPDLPITARRDELLDAIRSHQVLVVSGETGSGKSTQLPKLCLEAGRGTAGLIGHTQPRRLAARTIAERIADELGTEIGGAVGYAVRFTDEVGPHTQIKVMTDGILLAEIRRDRELRRYDTLIVDEAHERSLNIDFLLGYLAQLLPRRPDLTVVITSATIDTARFAAHFGGAPVIEVSGRSHPVEVRYRPAEDERDPTQAVADAVEELRGDGPGDILVFLSGEREIHDTARALRPLEREGVEILPLYARLSAAEQHRIFRAHQGQRVVLATNVAETSITVPGVRAVVDAGTARISRYSRRLKVQRLPIEPISRASADQRAGRCGRVAPGTCIRLYSEDDYAERPAFTEPEILRTNLASVLLQMAALRLGDVARFPFLDPPDARAVRDGVALLEELGAFDPDEPDADRRLTPLGRRLARLPIDPRLGRMLLEADRQGCVREVLVIVAALSIQDPRERPADAAGAADEAHRRFANPRSDFLAYLHLWDHLREQQRVLSGNQFRRLCRAEYLHFLRVREWQDLHRQLRQVLGDLGIRVAREPADPARIHRALLAGLLSQIGMRAGDANEYRGARGARFSIARGSALSPRPPRWVMAAELVETTRLWARVTARIQPEWAERLGAHLCTRTYAEPRWDRRRGAAVVTERVTLYGLPLVAGRAVALAGVDPAAARALFIQHALVEGDADLHHAAVDANRRLVEDVRALEVRARRQILGDAAIWTFYDGRMPDEVTSVSHFHAWWKGERRTQPDLLTMRIDDLVDLGPVDTADFPDVWHQGDLTLTLTYEFDPTSPTDGVTVHVPLTVLPALDAAGFDWQVPGFRHDLVVALLRSLPKDLRRQVIPAGERATSFLASPASGPLVECLASWLSREVGTAVPAAAFAIDELPAYLRVTFAVADEQGRVVATGKDLRALQAELAPRARAAVAEHLPSLERSGLRAWTFGTLPRRVEGTADGGQVHGYPTLVDQGDSVAVRIVSNPRTQARAMRSGTRRLLLLTMPSPRRALRAALDRTSPAEVLDACLAAAVDDLVDAHGGPAWDEESFRALRDAVADDLVDRAAEVARLVAEILAARNRIEQRLDDMRAPALRPAVADVRVQLAGLLFPGFVTAVGARRLPDVRRYLHAIERRLDALPGAVGRDAARMQRVRALDAHYRAIAEAVPADRADDAEQVRWMLEELRVSLFAQTLGTARPVSEQRIQRELDRLAAAT